MQVQSCRMNVSRFLVFPFVVLLLVQRVVAASSVPYTPSDLLVSPPQNDSLVYLLLSDTSDGEEQRTEFLSLNVSQEVDAGSPNYTTLLHQTPFRSEDPAAAFVPVIDQRGILKVYAGHCQNTSNPGVVWQFDPDVDSPIGNGTWKRLNIDIEHKAHGPNYLAAGFAYAVTDTTDSSVYTFGGMCPLNQTNANWMAAANYSQAMTVLGPSSDSSAYHMETAGKRAPPIAEAGFSVTPLLPTFSKSTKGSMLQQQDFLFVGGQTRNAFLNMSELAIYSLPQDSWSFVAVESDLTEAKTELVVRDTTAQVEPRSGHTAVLSPDGTKVIVVGGWVGNTSAPAHPQLAILEVGSEYGGYGSWAWKIPPAGDSFLSDGSGIYGHGTAMLPGHVMMITGGYHISQSSKRSTSSSQRNFQVYFYNVTSDSWATSYTNPNSQVANTSKASPASLSTAQKVGIGVGIGLGTPVLAALGLLAWKYSRNYRFRRTRNNELRKLALGAQRSHFWGRDEPEMASSIRGPSPRSSNLSSERSYPWAGNRGNGKSKWSDNGDAAAAERTGLLMNGLSSTRSNRPKINGPAYRSAGPSSDYRRNDPRSIHPIDERDEDEAHASDSLIAHDPNPPRGGLLGTVNIPDPHLEAPFLTSQSTNVEQRQGNTRAAPDGYTPLTNIDSRQDDGRSTPSDRRDRSVSNQSNSPKTMRLGVVPKSRATILHNPDNGQQSPNKSVVASTHSNNHTNSPTASSFDKRYSSDSYSTAHTSQSYQQAEGEHLLHEPPSEPAPIELPSRVAATSQRPKASEWLGSVRRVLSGGGKWAIPNKNDNKKNSVASLASGVDRRNTVLESKRTSQQSTDQEAVVPPRRAVSASAEFFRQKQGARDWGANPRSNRASRDAIPHPHYEPTEGDKMLMPSDHDDSDNEGDWDIDTAAEGRSVQVTFTVPKERLRVVNATARDMDSMSEGSSLKINRGENYRAVSG